MTGPEEVVFTSSAIIKTGNHKIDKSKMAKTKSTQRGMT
jgi:hypothetical protein